jgi:hypothetical protein
MRLAYLLLALTACPPKPPGGGGGGPLPTTGVGCPTATSVYVASYLTPDEGGKGHTGWVLPLFDKVASLPGGAEYATIDANAARDAGVPAAPTTLWMLVPGQPPCKLTPGQYYVAQIDSPTQNLAYGVELAGCQAPPDPQNASAILVASEQSPGDCQLVGPRGISSRLGDVDKEGKWSRPTKETPIPPAIAPLIPKHECTPPGCETLWSFAQIEVGGKTVAWAGAINWLQTSDPDPCNWKGERFSGFFVPGPDGNPVKVTEGQDHSLALTAVLADKTGPKVLVAEGPGEYSTFDLANGAKLGRHLVWLIPTPESYDVVDHLGAVCGGNDGP